VERHWKIGQKTAINGMKEGMEKAVGGNGPRRNNYAAWIGREYFWLGPLKDKGPKMCKKGGNGWEVGLLFCSVWWAMMESGLALEWVAKEWDGIGMDKRKGNGKGELSGEYSQGVGEGKVAIAHWKWG
jgi:hypothetical protein